MNKKAPLIVATGLLVFASVAGGIIAHNVIGNKNNLAKGGGEIVATDLFSKYDLEADVKIIHNMMPFYDPNGANCYFTIEITSTQDIGSPILLSAVIAPPSGNELSIVFEDRERFYSEGTSKYHYLFRSAGNYYGSEIYPAGDLQREIIVTVAIDGETQAKTLEVSMQTVW
ncbi:MAG: hypothetical protein FWH42_02800 [Dehalococcoidia bacterium]|nr:hypothetical protein [Dehalococcoidia bacterium]